jgi:hypothetical protein
MNTVRIGNGCGFWGDNLDAPIELARHGRLDYLTLEYLAELTMSILAQQKQRDPAAGFATDFLDVLERLLPLLTTTRGPKIVTNAGGMNPRACAARARALLDRAGLNDWRIGVVEGDDLLPRLDALLASGQRLAHLDTGERLADHRARVVSANVYLGSQPIAEALARGASLVITGRVADAALTVGPAVHELGWKWDDVDRLAAASVAGHLIECGAQATGGLWIHWTETDLTEVGYPLVEVEQSGTFHLSKPPGTGGVVNEETVAEQLLYEVGDPAAYLTPDVTADFTSIHLEQTGPDRVTVTGARGRPAPPTWKVSIAYRDGYMAAGTLVIAGTGAAEKARRCGDMILARLRRARQVPQRSLVECLGTGDSVPGVLPRCDPPEVVLRVAVADPSKAVVERFSREFAPLVTSGPPGVSGYTGGRPPVREVFAYWPALVDRTLIEPVVTLL